MSYPQAMQYLAEKYGIAWHVEDENPEKIAKKKAKEGLYILLEKATDYYKKNLMGASNPTAMAYLQARDLADPDLLDTFGLGYSFPEWRAFHHFAINEGYDNALLQEAGLLLVKEREGEQVVYDRFRGRLMFPLYNVIGKVIGFGARALNKNDPNTPKYINSPETPIYHKSHFLYGLYQAKQTIKKEKNCYLVEGYTDVLAMHQAGIKNVVATGGTALTPAQIALLNRFTHDVTLLFDGDVAGQEAALRGIDLLLAEGCDVKIVCLPPKEDPDSLRKKQGHAAFQQYLQDHVQDFISFKTEMLFANIGSDPAKQASATNSLLTTIATITDPLKRAFYLQACAQRLELPTELLEEKMAQLLPRQQRPQKKHFYTKKTKRDADPQKKHSTSQKERTMLYFLLHYADYAMDAKQRFADYLFEAFPTITFSDPDYQMVWNQCKTQWQTQGPFRPEEFIASQEEKFKKIAEKIMQKTKAPSPRWKTVSNIIFPKEKDNLAKSASRDIQRLKMAYLSELINENIQNLTQAKTEEEENKYWEEYQELKKRQKELAKVLGTTVLYPNPLSPHQP